MIKKICVFMVSVALLCGCSDNIVNTEDRNFLGGVGALHYTEAPASLGAAYDDENIYFHHGGVYRLDKEGQLMLNCDIATCKHDTLECRGNAQDGEYFVFNEKLYQMYNESLLENSAVEVSGYIRDCLEDEIVFENSVPQVLDEGKKVDSSNKINFITVISDDYMKIEGHYHAYIVDKDFNIVCWYGDAGKQHWGTLYEGNFYYINDLYQLSYINIVTGEIAVLDWDEKVIFADSDGENIFYFDEYNYLYRYSLKDEIKTKIGEDMFFFSVYDGYIYINRIIGEKKENLILDYDGNVKYDFTDNTYMGADNLLKVGDRLYNFVDSGDKTGIVSMNMDGTGYEFYELLE